MAAHLCGVIASMTTLPVIGVPINSTLDGMDALLAIVQMPPGIPVATVGINGALNAGILAVQMLAVGDEQLQGKLADYKENLKKKIVKANEELAQKYLLNTKQINQIVGTDVLATDKPFPSRGQGVLKPESEAFTPCPLKSEQIHNRSLFMFPKTN